MLRMAHVQPKNIRAFLEQLPQGLSLFRGWTDRADDFRFPHQVQV
jgi:hypothetical protein